MTKNIMRTLYPAIVYFGNEPRVVACFMAPLGRKFSAEKLVEQLKMGLPAFLLEIQVSDNNWCDSCRFWRRNICLANGAPLPDW